MYIFIVLILFFGVLIYFSDKIKTLSGCLLLTCFIGGCCGYIVHKIEVKEIDNTPTEIKKVEFRLNKLTDTNVGDVYDKNDWVAQTKLFCGDNNDFTILNIDLCGETKTIVLVTNKVTYHQCIDHNYQSIILNSDVVRILTREKCIIMFDNNIVADVYINKDFFKDFKCIKK